MTDYNNDWELFSATGDIDAYLKYKSSEAEKNFYGQHKNEGFDNKDERLW